MTLEDLERMEEYCATIRKELERKQTDNNDDWLSYKQLVQEYSFPGVKSVQRRDWRIKHNFFPCKVDAKGCHLRINRRLLENWLYGEGYSCNGKYAA